MYLNGIKKFLVILDQNKKEVKNEIKTLDDIVYKAQQKFIEDMKEP